VKAHCSSGRRCKRLWLTVISRGISDRAGMFSSAESSPGRNVAGRVSGFGSGATFKLELAL